MTIRSYSATTSSSVRWLAILGTAFAVGHFTFAPVVVPVIDAMCCVYDVDTGKETKGKKNSEIVLREKDERSIELQKRWNQVHLTRTLLVDLPAMLCFATLALWEQ